MEPSSCSLTPQEIARRTQRFASLRAAQRALSNLARVSDLEGMMDQGGELLVQLQALSVRAPEIEGAALSPEESAADLEALHGVDRLLDQMSARTGAALDRISISQLRLTLKERAAEHREEVRGVIDVILDGDVEDEARLAMLEFLVTLLCAEDHDTGRRVVREPSDAVPRLAAIAAKIVADDDPESMAAEKAFVDARAKLFEAGSVGA
jgi:hypothetical protein